MSQLDTSFWEYLGDFLFISIGVFGGSAITVVIIAAFGGNLPRFLGLTGILPSVGPPLFMSFLTHVIAIIGLTIPPALGVLTVLYLDYLSRR